MARIKDIIKVIADFAHEKDTMPSFDDNVGLLVGTDSSCTDKVIVCLDVSDVVVDEAISAGAKLIVTHHPVIFRPISCVSDSSPTGNVIVKALMAGISIYSAHTNLDFCDGGINEYNAELLGLCDVSALETVDGIKIGRVGKLATPVTHSELCDKVKDAFGSSIAVGLGDKSKLIGSVAIVNGSGGCIDYIAKAISIGADCYISAEFPHHALLFASANKYNIIELRHYDMEQVYIKRWIQLLAKLSAEKQIDIQYLQSKNESNPIWIKE